jgi:hypothetical protein
MPLFGHSKGEDQAADVSASSAASSKSPDFDALLRHFNDLPLAQRAAELLTGISSQLQQGERSAMDRLLSPWLPDQYSDADRPDSWYTLKYVLAEAFQALELARMVFRIDESPRGPTTCYYAISSDGRTALERGDVAEVLARRLPD